MSEASTQSECDFTRPIDDSITPSLQAIRRRHEATARYDLYGIPLHPHLRAEKRILGKWLTYAQATDLCESFSDQASRLYPGMTFARPIFGIDLIVPQIQQPGLCAPGDIVVHASSRGRLVIAGQASAVTKGRPVSVRHWNGDTPVIGKCWTFGQQQFRMPGASENLMEREARHAEEGHYGALWGFFDDAKAVARVLQPHLEHHLTVWPNHEDVAIVLGQPRRQ